MLPTTLQWTSKGHRGSLGRVRGRRRNLSVMFLPISCFFFGYHPVFIACLIWTLGTLYDGNSESQILYSLQRYFIQIWKWSGNQKPVCTLAVGREALEFQDGDWSSSGNGTIWAQSRLVICRDSWDRPCVVVSKEGLQRDSEASKMCPSYSPCRIRFSFFLFLFYVM